MASEITIGGQAVMEGVMMRSNKNYAICVRRPDGKISTKKIPVQDDKWYNKIPLIRGVSRFAETVTIGIKSMSYSAAESSGEEDSFSFWEMLLTISLAVLLTLGLFILAPLLLTRLFVSSEGILFNLLDGVLRLLIFFAYLVIISLFPDIRRIFQYHGAEHKTVFCHEEKKKLTVENVKKYPTLHPRCGTNFIMIVFVVSVFVFSLIPAEDFQSKILSRVLLLPIIAGISYEYLRFAGKNFSSAIVRLSIWPGLMLQKITTKEPDDDMIEVAIKALKAAL